MPTVYLGVHLPFKPYQKLKVEDIDLSCSTDTLRAEVAKLIQSDVAPDDFELIYCGSLLQTDDVLQNKGIGDGSTVYVIQKRPERKNPPASEQPQEGRTLSIAEAQELMSVWNRVDSSNFQKVRQPEFMKNVLDAYPAIRRNLFVLSMLKDPILLSSMQQPETIRRVALKHPILLEASPTIVQLLNSKMIQKTANCHLSAPLDNALDDPLSDSSSSDDNTTSPTTSTVVTMRRITADNLASALAFAGQRGSYNSLSNISQRDADSRANQHEAAPDGAAPSASSGTNSDLPSTSMAASASQASTSTTLPVPAAAGTGGEPSRAGPITSSMLLDAISIMYEQQRGETAATSGPGSTSTTSSAAASGVGERPGATEPMDTSPATAGTAPPVSEPMGADLGAQTMSQHSTLAASIGQYRRELDQMREMGLTDTETNLQALLVCNGNVESAINLVLGGMSN
ncbi:ubiquitin-like protein 7 [Anopheles nili]|uniref:ubiquitin-like protein 7 n=1 Tax=Anopheles nili TaxID=185578 RepID=UPI00237AF7E8|nr:ubiquitin-like protein 7 [Anopheles nili]